MSLDQERNNYLKQIKGSLSWATLWLFIIAMNTCGTQIVQVIE
jgi:hypothetical protein